MKRIHQQWIPYFGIYAIIRDKSLGLPTIIGGLDIPNNVIEGLETKVEDKGQLQLIISKMKKPDEIREDINNYKLKPIEYFGAIAWHTVTLWVPLIGLIDYLN